MQLLLYHKQVYIRTEKVFLPSFLALFLEGPATACLQLQLKHSPLHSKHQAVKMDVVLSLTAINNKFIRMNNSTSIPLPTRPLDAGSGCTSTTHVIHIPLTVVPTCMWPSITRGRLTENLMLVISSGLPRTLTRPSPTLIWPVYSTPQNSCSSRQIGKSNKIPHFVIPLLISSITVLSPQVYSCLNA